MNFYIPFIKSHVVEISLLAIAIIITSVTATSYFSEETIEQKPEVLSAVSDNRHPPTIVPSKLTIDVSGAVLKPDVYEVSEGARLADVIKQAGGFEKDADNGYIARNFNMARFVTDEEKIYIPFKQDIASGMFTESPHVLDYVSSDTRKPDNQNPSNNETSSILISINTATKDELDTLPGIGPTTAQKIIDSRPYATLDELLSKQTIKQSIFDKIKELISL